MVKTNEGQTGLKNMRAKKGERKMCDNCKCERYTKCGCMKRAKKSE